MRKLLMMATATVMTVTMAAATGYAQRGNGPAGPPPPDGGGMPRAARPGPPGRPRTGMQGPGGPGGPAGAIGGALGRLNLTDEQRAQARDILLKSRDEAAPLADQLQLARKDLRREIFADKRDSGKLKELSAKVDSLRKQVSEIRLNARGSIAGLLTPEQRLQMRARPMRPGGAGPRGRRAVPPPVG